MGLVGESLLTVCYEVSRNQFSPYSIIPFKAMKMPLICGSFT